MSFRLTWRIVLSFRLCQLHFLVTSIWSKWSSDWGMDIIKDFYNWQCLARSWLPNSLLCISRLNVFICCCRPTPHPPLALCPIGVSLTLRTASPGFLCCFLIGFSQCEALVDIRALQKKEAGCLFFQLPLDNSLPALFFHRVAVAFWVLCHHCWFL